MPFVTFLWPTEYEHLNLAKLMYSIEAPVQDKNYTLSNFTKAQHSKINLNAEQVECLHINYFFMPSKRRTT